MVQFWEDPPLEFTRAVAEVVFKIGTPLLLALILWRIW